MLTSPRFPVDGERHWQEVRSRAFREHGLQPPPGFAEQALGLHCEDRGRLMAQSVHKPELTEEPTASLGPVSRTPAF